MTSSIVSLLSITGRMLSSYHPGDAFPFGNATPHDPSFFPPPDDFVPFSPAPTEKFIKKDHDNDGSSRSMTRRRFRSSSPKPAKASESGTENATANMTDAEIRDKIKQKKWTEPDADGPSPRPAPSSSRPCPSAPSTPTTRAPFVTSCTSSPASTGSRLPCSGLSSTASGSSSSGFLMGNQASRRRYTAKMFDIADNPISALMIGILATVLVQSSSTTTSIIVALVGANEPCARRRLHDHGRQHRYLRHQHHRCHGPLRQPG